MGIHNLPGPRFPVLRLGACPKTICAVKLKFLTFNVQAKSGRKRRFDVQRAGVCSVSLGYLQRALTFYGRYSCVKASIGKYIYQGSSKDPNRKQLHAADKDIVDYASAGFGFLHLPTRC